MPTKVWEIIKQPLKLPDFFSGQILGAQKQRSGTVSTGTLLSILAAEYSSQRLMIRNSGNRPNIAFSSKVYLYWSNQDFSINVKIMLPKQY